MSAMFHKRIFVGICVVQWAFVMSAQAVSKRGSESIHIKVTGTSVPYKQVLYALEKTADIFTFRVRRTPHAHGRASEEVVLLTRAEWTRLVSPLGGFVSSVRSRKGAGAVIYSVEHRTGEGRRTLVWDEALMGAQHEANEWLREIRVFAAARLKPVTYWDDELDHKSSGLLLVSSQPNACVMVNSIPLGFSESYRSLRVTPGSHEVVFLRTDDGSTWPYSVRVKAKLTTRLEVELR